MKKTRVMIILSAGCLITSFYCGLSPSRADQAALDNNENQVVKDEGYGNDDAEYYNSEDDRVNDEDSSAPQENSALKSTGNDVQ